ncbi:NAD(P)-dependent oxidoreductase [Umezawaea tangerina]|uniref:3-hydroxyisobutyrate dehydrogenase-like beta-hydroxyacid dehydrogenase n=1 Tax=Umezawaea tangerina TaxID=84725 RepID=A0A2T0TI17_9PSEU|nr:NAD(P)-binding domain-containing protein [Umezawaea tangerina]PRY45251.1 3-hydroxyisobutyrate dehydrogenase-like beta-hydroxyacid dehydrogenase [Umezawaea tangerina]
MTDLPAVTVLGLGPMGRALAAALAASGHPTTVWNRSPGKADGLAAREAASLADAVHASPVVLACLVDYAALTSALEPLRADWGDRVLVNLGSGTPAQARATTGWAAARGIAYLDGAILTPTPTIGTPAAVVLCSGGPDVHAAAAGTLASLGGTTTHLGDDPGLANAYDVALLDLFATAVHGVVHAFALAAAEHVPATALAPFATGIGALLPEMITRFARQLDGGTHPGDRSTIASAGSAIRHVTATARGHGLDTGALTAAGAVIDRAIADGHGADGLSRLTRTLLGA